MNTTAKELSADFDRQTPDGRRRTGGGSNEAMRAWPRCEPGSTHFELGASSDYRPTAVMAKRYTPRCGARKE
jgi:hypothetical protein